MEEKQRPSNKELSTGAKIFVTFICMAVLLSGIYILSGMFNKEAIGCLKDPLAYGTTLVSEKHNSSMYCACTMDRLSTLHFNESGVYVPERIQHVYTPSNKTVKFNFSFKTVGS